MTLRSRVLAVGLVATATLLGLAAVAHAQTTTTSEQTTEPTTEEPGAEPAAEEPELDKFEEECVHLLTEGHELEECQQSPHKFRPEWNEVIWGSIFFGVVAIGLWKFAVPAMKKGMAARSERIGAEVARAEEARSGAEQQRSEFERMLGDAAAERERILAGAREQAEVLRRELVARAETEAAELRQRATDDTRLLAERARADLEAQVASLSVRLAQLLVERSLDDQTQQGLVDRYIEQLGSRRS
jgi:F-type H+-transporting ATPase subunit b